MLQTGRFKSRAAIQSTCSPEMGALREGSPHDRTVVAAPRDAANAAQTVFGGRKNQDVVTVRDRQGGDHGEHHALVEIPVLMTIAGSLRSTTTTSPPVPTCWVAPGSSCPTFQRVFRNCPVPDQDDPNLYDFVSAAPGDFGLSRSMKPIFPCAQRAEQQDMLRIALSWKWIPCLRLWSPPRRVARG
jgi:hypothetical protein